MAKAAGISEAGHFETHFTMYFPFCGPNNPNLESIHVISLRTYILNGENFNYMRD